MALVNAGLREKDRALTWLERALIVRDVHLVFLTIENGIDDIKTTAISRLNGEIVDRPAPLKKSQANK